MIKQDCRPAIVPGAPLQFLQLFVRYVPFVIALGFFIWCLVVELWQIPMPLEQRMQFYSTFGSVCWYGSILCTTVYGRNYGLGWIKSLIFSFLCFQVVFSWASWYSTQLDILIFGTGAVISGRSAVFLPLLCWILSKFCKQDTLTLCDFLTPFFFFNHGIVTVACWIRGCCAGQTTSWGLLNPESGLILFPTQPCIIILSLAVAWWGLSYSKKHMYQTKGMVFANSLILYGIFRYLIELFTDDMRVLWILSWISVCSLGMIAEGFLVRFIAGKKIKNHNA